LADHSQTKEMIVALLEHLSKGLEDSSNLPNQETYSEMEEAKVFKEKNLVTAQKTMESLTVEKKKRANELELLKQSEPRLRKELETIKETMARMRREIREFQDIEGLRKAFDVTQSKLVDLKQSYNKRRDSIRQQTQMLTSEHESLKKQYNSNDVAKDLEETERRLKHYERTIYELKEFVEVKGRETDYELTKSASLKVSLLFLTSDGLYKQYLCLDCGYAKYDGNQSLSRRRSLQCASQMVESFILIQLLELIISIISCA
jgi:uncharacterized phage infection (PIP) family protein YhgE